MQWLVEEDVTTEVYTRVIHPWEYLIWRNLQEALNMNIDFFEQVCEHTELLLVFLLAVRSC